MTSTTPRTICRVSRLALSLGLAAALLLGVGCSQDRHVFRSTPTAPKTVSVVSYETGNTLWSMDIPPEQQLFIDFSRKGKGFEEFSSPDIPADKFVWETWSLDAIVKWNKKRRGGSKIDGGTVNLSGEAVYLNVDIRDAQSRASR